MRLMTLSKQQRSESLVPKFGSWVDNQNQTSFSTMFEDARANKVARAVNLIGPVSSKHAFGRDRTVQKSNDMNITADLVLTQISQSHVVQTDTPRCTNRGNPYAADETLLVTIFPERSSTKKKETISSLESGRLTRIREYGKSKALRDPSKELQSTVVLNNTKIAQQPPKAKIPVFYDCQVEKDVLSHPPNAVPKKFRITWISCFSADQP
ncbi:hypothetical protein O6H91_08G028800 [Diphasiastrum complanatum]|uniref:Uncharacterized protein n=1 Tax=Diphasiastrum complanatum TaxID=34168 RepID=A0ACC2CW09_DIPCM|nr:hypothetical protein O6H91_08G028800 [Diphasiastrum complanatum]